MALADKLIQKISDLSLYEEVSITPTARGFEWEERFGATVFSFALSYENLGRRPEEAASVKLVVSYKNSSFAEFYYRVGKGPKASTILELAQARGFLTDLKSRATKGVEYIGLNGEFYPVAAASELLAGLRAIARGKPYSGSLVAWPSDLVDSGIIIYKSPQGQQEQKILSQGQAQPDKRESS
jgi:hypothetical protein